MSKLDRMTPKDFQKEPQEHISNQCIGIKKSVLNKITKGGIPAGKITFMQGAYNLGKIKIRK